MKIGEFFNKLIPAVSVSRLIFENLKEKAPIKRIDEIAKTTNGGTPLRNTPEFWDGEIPWLNSGQLKDGVIKSYDQTITEQGLKKSSAKKFPQGTLLVAMYGATVGKVGIIDFESATNQAVCAIFPDQKILRDYLYWFLRQKRFDYLNESFGGAQPNISQKVIKVTEVPVPDLEIQEEIVTCLNEIEASQKARPLYHYPEIDAEVSKIISHRKNYDTILKSFGNQLEQISYLRQTILQEAIQGKLTQEWRKANPDVEPADQLLERIQKEKQRLIEEKQIKKEKPLPPVTEEEKPFPLPEGWVWCRLQNYFDVRDGTHETPKYKDEGIPLVTSKNLYTGKLDLVNCKFISKEDHEKISNRSKVDKYDIIFGMIGTIGNPVIVDFEPNFSIKNVALIKYFDINLVVPQFLLYFLKSISESLKMRADGGVQSFVSLKKIRELAIPVPPLKEQKAIAEKVDQLMNYCDELESRVKQSQTHAEQLMEAVLKEVFEGEEEADQVMT